ncbi:SPFH domain-containing protein [Acutalibacter caecimuris]|uniref:SPFH domain-containing protein n=1 Tax=Acutalibacter caecimuris TaxID=3093657 RepID=UPI002AC96F38|nr:SPFH domain-containing protein [Acutalibacter sp. M00118]
MVFWRQVLVILLYSLDEKQSALTAFGLVAMLYFQQLHVPQIIVLCVAMVDNGGQWLIHKYPSEQFVLGSQLIVNQGQEALFFKGGEALDLFGPGTHTLSTGNLPLLYKLVNLPFGGKTPFSAEIYYINTTDNIDMKWGTSTPIPLEDPRL